MRTRSGAKVNGDFQELIEFLEGKFGRIEERLGGMDGRLDGMDGRLDGMDGRIANVEAGVEGNRTAIRELGVLVERNHGLIQTVAEQVRAVDSKLDRKVDGLGSEMEAGFREMRELLLGRRGLDRRVTDLERRVDVLEEGR